MAPTKRIDEAWGWLKRVAATESEFKGETNAGFVSEFDVLKIDPTVPLNGNANRLTDLEDEALPLLANGLLESASDVQGHLGYRTTEAGRAALVIGKPRKPRGLPAYDAKLGDEFIDHLGIARLLGGDQLLADLVDVVLDCHRTQG